MTININLFDFFSFQIASTFFFVQHQFCFPKLFTLFIFRIFSSSQHSIFSPTFYLLCVLFFISHTFQLTPYHSIPFPPSFLFFVMIMVIIRSMSGVEDGELRRTLQSLASGLVGTRVLLKSPKVRTYVLYCTVL